MVGRNDAGEVGGVKVERRVGGYDFGELSVKDMGMDVHQLSGQGGREESRGGDRTMTHQIVLCLAVAACRLLRVADISQVSSELDLTMRVRRRERGLTIRAGMSQGVDGMSAQCSRWTEVVDQTRRQARSDSPRMSSTKTRTRSNTCDADPPSQITHNASVPYERLERLSRKDDD